MNHKFYLISLFIWIAIIFARISASECENWVIEIHYGNCTKTGRIIHCFGKMGNLHKLNSAKVQRVEEVILCGWPNSFDPEKELESFPSIRVLRIEHSNLTHFYNDFFENFHLENINISWTKLSHIQSTVFKKLHSLKYLDLRWNNLAHIESLALPETFNQLYLDGNPWNCTDRIMKWLLNSQKNIHVSDRELLQCADKKFENKHLLTVMHFKWILKTACQFYELQNCTCNLYFLLKNQDGGLTPHYAINCSSLNLNRFPSYIPQNTTTFYVMDNQITDLRPLRNNMYYRNVLDLYLDGNKIQSIDVLEAGYWLRNFRVLSLRRNLLSKLPMYALNNALDTNKNVINLQLSQNPWICDCKFTMRFQATLMKFNNIIKDARNVTCHYMDNEKRIVGRVLELERHSVCKLPDDYKIHSLDLLNGFLLLLIILVLLKLVYDYYNYRTYGKLPWIIMKLP